MQYEAKFSPLMLPVRGGKGSQMQSNLGFESRPTWPDSSRNVSILPPVGSLPESRPQFILPIASRATGAGRNSHAFSWHVKSTGPVTSGHVSAVTVGRAAVFVFVSDP
jgi:hypothetical protein